MDGAADAAVAPLFDARDLEGGVEVRAGVALRPGASQHVAGAALLDEQLLAGDQVRVVLAGVPGAAGGRQGRRGQRSDPGRASHPIARLRPGHERREPYP